MAYIYSLVISWYDMYLNMSVVIWEDTVYIIIYVGNLFVCAG